MADRHEKLAHIFPSADITTRRPYTTPGTPRDPLKPKKYPKRPDPAAHARSLLQQIQTIANGTGALAAERQQAAVADCTGTFIDVQFVPNEDFPLKSLADARASIELVAVVDLSPQLAQATLFVPDGQLKVLERKIEAFAPKDPNKVARNKPLISSLETIRRSVARSFWTDPSRPFPTDQDDHWWEIWLRQGVDVLRFRRHATALGMHVSPRELRFPDRTVLLVRASVEGVTRSAELLDSIAELRGASPLDLEFVGIDVETELATVGDLAHRLTRAAEHAPSICLLDTGVDFEHPLLRAALARADVHTCFGEDIRDRFGAGDWHGTGAAGLALYGLELADALLTAEVRTHTHHLESVKYIPSTGHNEPDLYGEITKEAVARVEVAQAARSRIILNTVTAEPVAGGEATSWSAAIDQLCSGYDDEVRRLVVLAAGNVVPHTGYAYPDTNHVQVVESPGQAWNALTVGAFTGRCEIAEGEYESYSALAKAGHMSPTTRTSIAWDGVNRMAPPPFKPDFVCEGGNWAQERPNAVPVTLDSLTPLSTRRRDTVRPRLLGRFGATSGASALAANLAAQLQAEYPALWPETVRALLVHSCRYTPAMMASFDGLTRRRRAEALLRCFGYGVPDLERSRYSARNELTLVIEREIQPFRIDPGDGKGKTNHMHLHRLPWPSDVLESLGELETRLRVTLSYFVEPNPGKRHVAGSARTLIVDPARYPSFGLRFDVTTPGETEQDLLLRVNAAERTDGEEVDAAGDLADWHLGRSRTRGSLHSDVWTGTAVKLADKSAVAVYPVSGWWRFHNKDPETCERTARYSLIVSIETDAEEVDVYAPVYNLTEITR